MAAAVVVLVVAELVPNNTALPPNCFLLFCLFTTRETFKTLSLNHMTMANSFVQKFEAAHFLTGHAGDGDGAERVRQYFALLISPPRHRLHNRYPSHRIARQSRTCQASVHAIRPLYPEVHRVPTARHQAKAGRYPRQG